MIGLNRRLTAVLLLVTFALSTAHAQLNGEKKYAASAAFAVRRNVWLFVRYSGDGKACELSLEPRHWTGDTMIVDTALDADEVLRIVEEVVPESERGKRHKEFPNGLMSLSGNTYTSLYEYDKLSVHFGGGTTSGLAVAVVDWPDRRCPADR